MRFEFATANRIIFGAGVLADIGEIAAGFGANALIVTGRDVARAEPLLDRLRARGVGIRVCAVAGEPSIDDIVCGTIEARLGKCDLVIGFGGGAALDAAKAIAVMVTNDGSLTDYLEVVGRAQSLQRPGVPCIAIPTTAGTGSEVTRNAVLASPGHRVKVSLRGPYLLPRVALVDPQLTVTLPPALTASTGLDALTQLIEPFVCTRATPLTDGFAVEGIGRVARSLRRAVADGSDIDARTDMALASVLGGLALANAGLGAVHGLAGPIGGMFPGPHGAVCAALLPHVMEANLAALRARGDVRDTLRRFEVIGRLLTGESDANANDGVEWVSALVRDLRIPGLSNYGVTESDFAAIIGAAGNASSMKANPIALTAGELGGVLERAL